MITKRIALMSLLFSSNVFAFGDDVCYFPTFDQQVINCYQLPDPCLDDNPDNDTQCANAVLLNAMQAGTDTDILRSSLHSDATYLLAQAVGFNKDQAFSIASYNQAMDHGVYTARNLLGEPLGGEYSDTANINGLNRGNFISGGNLLHFVTPANGAENGLEPNKTNPHEEPLLAHVRLWALASYRQTIDQFCTGGITNVSAKGDYATGVGCYKTNLGHDADLAIAIRNLQGGSNQISSSTGTQIIQQGSPNNGLPKVYADDFDQHVGIDIAKEARIGVYLHVLQDRISHHICLDSSSLTGPGIDGNFWLADLSNEECAQDIHVLRHAYEQATDYDQLDTSDQTTLAALKATYSELQLFAQLNNLQPVINDAEPLMENIAETLKIVDAVTRLESIAQISCDNQLNPYPGVVESCN